MKVFTSDRCEETKGAGEMRTMQQVQVCLDLALGFGKKCSGFWQVGKIRSGPRMPRNATWDCAFGHTHCRYTHSLSLSLRPNRGGLDCASQRSNSSLQLGHVRNTHHFERDCDWRLNAFRSQAGPEAARLTRNKPGDCCRSRAQSAGQPELQARSLRWNVEEWGGGMPRHTRLQVPHLAKVLHSGDRRECPTGVAVIGHAAAAKDGRGRPIVSTGAAGTQGGG